jgi:putative Mg2+ transporter-C (MgtC) family protein
MTYDWVDLGRLLAAVAAGALIGFERETHDKPAGFRTNILISLGAALFTLLSIRMADSETVDRTRIAAQIVTGVGFLGAGAIIQYRGNVIGLTTAATIWVVSSVGMAFGAGEFFLGTCGTLLATAVLFALESTEDLIAHWRTIATFELDFAAGNDVDATVGRLVDAAGVRRKSWNVSRTPDGVIGRLIVVGPERSVEKLQTALSHEPGLRGFRRQ